MASYFYGYQPCYLATLSKGLINLFDRRFSKKLEKHEELDTLVGIFSYISKTETANLSTGSAEETMSGSSHSCRLQPNSRHVHEDLNYPNEENRKRVDKLSNPLELLAQSLITYGCKALFPYLQIYRNDGIPSAHFGIRAHLSICSSHKVLEMVDRLPEIVVVEELPRLRLENRDCKSRGALDLNISLADATDMTSDDKIRAITSWRRGNTDFLVRDHDLSVQYESATLEDGTWMYAACVGGKTNIDAQGDIPMVEKNDADNVEVQGMLPMEENNNADNVDPSSPPSPSFVAPTIYEEDEDLNVWLAAVTLYFLTKRS
ncbi:hypothetical protein RIF29_33438 [Crotalaria pallida]|uniref:Uncharacterized protein n=1 Tax=Crotalaria pallida TaxID=3830 RepID=A0AAN9EA09_CROPI